MVELCGIKDVVAGGRRFDTSAETGEKASRISSEKRMVIVSMTA